MVVSYVIFVLLVIYEKFECYHKKAHQYSIFFQNEEILVQLDELEKLDRITHE